MPKTLDGRRVVSAWRRLLREEEGVALVLVIVSMLVLTLMLTAVMFMTAAGARDAHRSNAGQKASALAESGINNALAVLNSNYPGIVVYPGDPNLLPSRTTPYPSGSVTWSGAIEAAPTTATWEDQWRITSVGTVANPTGPSASPVARRMTAIVPIVIPETVSINPSSSSLNWVYAFNDIHFDQSVTVRSPVYANGDLWIEQTAKIGETIPANASGPLRLNKLAVGGNLYLENPQNTVGHALSPVGPLGPRSRRDPRRGHVLEARQDLLLRRVRWGAGDDVWGIVTDHVIPPGFITVPKLTCCSPYLGSNGHPELSGDPSVMGFWYRNASIGPNSLCQTSSGTPPRFDRPTGARRPRRVDRPERDRWADCRSTLRERRTPARRGRASSRTTRRRGS